MKILNLVYPEKSDIKYQIQKFPDGQQNIVIDGNGNAKYLGLKEITNPQVQIKSRLNNWLDLELITCAVASLRELGVEKIHLYTPYIMGARSDRKFEEGGNNYLKDVICPIINSLNFKTVTCVDGHSDVLEACLNNFRKESNLDLVKFSLMKIYDNGFTHGRSKGIIDNNIILISPDAGASKKIYKLAEQIGYKGDVITCSKDRDENGKLTKCVVPTRFEHVGKDFIIVDDICSRGGTFINIAKELIRQFENSATHNKIYLIITHYEGTADIEILKNYFKKIYCTNSMNDIDNDFIKQINVY